MTCTPSTLHSLSTTDPLNLPFPIYHLPIPSSLPLLPTYLPPSTSHPPIYTSLFHLIVTTPPSYYPQPSPLLLTPPMAVLVITHQRGPPGMLGMARNDLTSPLTPSLLPRPPSPGAPSLPSTESTYSLYSPSLPHTFYLPSHILYLYLSLTLLHISSLSPPISSSSFPSPSPPLRLKAPFQGPCQVFITGMG